MSKIRPMSPEEIESVRAAIAYDQATGLFSHAVDKRGGRVKAGSTVKTKPSPNGYLYIGVGGRIYLAHRLAWLLAMGEWPELQIDHIDHDRSNNRLKNLRTVTPKGNKMNETRRTDNKSGVTGVSWSSNDQKWVACLFQDGRSIHLGYFADKADAVAARAEANDNYGFHANHGKPRSQGVA